MTLRIEVWALPLAGPAVPLPDLGSWDVAPSDVGDWGSLKLDYPTNGRNYAVLAAISDEAGTDLRVEVALTDAAGRQWLTGGFLQNVDTDDVAETGIAKCSGVLDEIELGEAVTPYHPTGENGDTPLSGTAGKIMRELLQAAQLRGWGVGVTWTFTDSHDSNGAPWASTAVLRASPGQHYAAILGTLRGYRLAEWDFTFTRELRLTNVDGKGADRTIVGGSLPVLTLEHGRDLDDAPRKRSWRGALTALVSSGKDGLYTSASDTAAQTRRGRRVEGYQSFGSAADSGTLSALTQARLAVRTAGTTAISHKIVLGPGSPLPLLDYGLSDWVLSSTRRGVERRRVVQITVSGSADTATSAAVDLTAVVDDAVLGTSQRLDALERGEAVVGTSVPSPDVDDGSTPAQVTGLVVTSLHYATGEGVGLASVIAGWVANPDSRVVGYIAEWRYSEERVPPTSTAGLEKIDAAALIRARLLSGLPIFEDWTWAGAPAVVGRWNDVLLDEFVASGSGSATTFLGAYTPSQTSTGWRREPAVKGTSTSWSGVTAGAPVRVRVAAVNRYDRRGPFSTVVTLTTETDSTPPPVGSAPTPYPALGLVIVPWNGRGSAGEGMPGDFLRAEVHLSTTSGFTPSRPLIAGTSRLDEAASTTYTGELRANGELPVDVGVAGYGTTFFTRLVLVDRTGNAAAASAQGSVVARAVQDGEVANLSIGKLTVGIMSAIMTISGIIRTAASGARVELDAAGLRCIAADGTTVLFEFSIPTSLLSIVGRLVAGAGIGIGPTVIVDPGVAGIDFYPSATTQRTRMRARTTTRGDGTTAAGFALDTLNSSGQTDGFAVDAWSTNVWLGHKLTSGVFAGGRLILERVGGFAGLFAHPSAGGAIQAQVLVTNGGQVDIFGNDQVAIDGVGDTQILLGFDGSFVQIKANNNNRVFMGLAGSQLISGGTVKSFVVDHPLDDPDDPRRWLVHGCTESPVGGVEYAGTEVIADHLAVVELPPYFEALCATEGRTVQLTPELTTLEGMAMVPSAAPSPVVDGRFHIVCPAPDGTRVHWLVKATRRGGTFDVEPLRTDVDAHGDGPYRYLTPRTEKP